MSMTEKKINSWITITSHFVLLVQTKQGFWMLIYVVISVSLAKMFKVHGF